MNAPLTLVPRSSLGRKYLMALTGLGLTGFVVVHMLGNFQIFLGREFLNAYAHNLKHMSALLWGARLALLSLFVAHIVYGVRLTLANRAARPVPYAAKKYREASFPSRTMLPTGLVLLAFVVFHIAHYTLGIVKTAPVRTSNNDIEYVPYLSLGEVDGKPSTDVKDPKYRPDVYAMTIYGFRDPVVSATYVVAMAFLALHLSHGFQSAFQSLGLNHPHWTAFLKKASYGLAAVVFLGNSSMPIAILLGLIGGDVPQ